MNHAGLLRRSRIPAAVVCGCVFACTCQAQEAGRPGFALGNMKANRILVLGNSITLHGVHQPYGWLHACGMAASVPEKDYVHLLVAGLDTRTGGHLRISIADTTRPGPDGALVTEAANVLNIADIFERHYADYTNSRLQRQLDAKPDIVVLQFGENMPRDTFSPVAFKAGLQTLMNGLRTSGNPHIFVTSQILGSGGAVDEIKREVCAEDPSHRVFVDLSDFGKDPTNFASSEPYYTGVIVGHPGDRGMARIADALLKAMVAHATKAGAAPPPAVPAGQ